MVKKYVEIDLAAGDPAPAVDRMFVELMETNLDGWNERKDRQCLDVLLMNIPKMLDGIRYWMNVAYNEQQKKQEYEVDLVMLGIK